MLGIGSNADILAFVRLILSFTGSILCKPIVAYVVELKATLFDYLNFFTVTIFGFYNNQKFAYPAYADSMAKA